MSNPLTNLLPDAVRRDVYAVVAVASAAFGIWQATGGNWTAFAAGVVGALTSALAHGNVPLPSSVVTIAKDAAPVVEDIAAAAPVAEKIISDVQAAETLKAATADQAAAKKSAAKKAATPPAAK